MTSQEIPRLVGASSGFLDLKRQIPRGLGGAVQNLGEMGAPYSKPKGQISDCFIEGVRMPCHAFSVVCDTIKSSGNEIAPMSLVHDSMEMNTWPQRPTIKAAVLAYRKEHQLSPKEMADLLGVGPSYLHNVLYDKRVWPSLDLAQELSKVLGLKLGEVVDDPGEEIAGANPDNSDFDRFMLKTMGKDLTEMTDAQKQAGFQVWKSFMDGISNK